MNLRSRKGSDYLQTSANAEYYISIHAPTRGATKDATEFYFSLGISIHAPTRGATKNTSIIIRRNTHFNPRSHKGSDVYKPFSQHLHSTFQSTLPQGERQDTFKFIIIFKQFQSTLPQGERPFWFLLSKCFTYFNPRSHKGSDKYNTASVSLPSIFQSTLPQGERLHSYNSANSFSNFNPRSHKGSDVNGFSGYLESLLFQSTLPQGERQVSKLDGASDTDFNPRSHKGSDDSKRSGISGNIISIHAPTRGATKI